MATGQWECGCGQEAAGSFAPWHDTETLRMLLHLQGVLDRNEPISDFLRRHRCGRDVRNLIRAYQDRLYDDAPPPADASRLQPAQLTPAHRGAADLLKRPVGVGPQHRNQLRHVRAPKKPAVYVFSDGDRLGFVGRIGNLYKPHVPAPEQPPWFSTLAGKSGRLRSRTRPRPARRTCTAPTTPSRARSTRPWIGSGPWT